MERMERIMGMVRSGRLAEATEEIQRGLRGGTPVRRRAPSAKAGPRAKGSPARARRGPSGDPGPLPSGSTWARGRAGAMPYRLFSPARPDPDAPFVVMLHGCTQTPEDFARGTRMAQAADAAGAHVLWPEQTRAANPQGCWSWFDPAHQGSTGEAGAIAALAARLAAAQGARGGIHVAGLSAGGAMAAILGTHHADTVASVGIHSGLAAGSARDVASAFAAMRRAPGAATPLAVPAILFHGTADRTVAPDNAAAMATAAPGPKPRRRTGRTGGRAHAVTRFEGPPPLELWEVEGLGHAWSGGHPSGSHADPAGPDATAEMLRFFRAHTPR